MSVKVRINHFYSNTGLWVGSSRGVVFVPGDEMDLPEEVADFLERDSPGVITRISEPVPEEPAEPEGEVVTRPRRRRGG